MRELLYNAANHYKRGTRLAEDGDTRAALAAYAEAVADLHAVKPQRMRDVLLAQVHLSRYKVALGRRAQRRTKGPPPRLQLRPHHPRARRRSAGAAALARVPRHAAAP